MNDCSYCQPILDKHHAGQWCTNCLHEKNCPNECNVNGDRDNRIRDFMLEEGFIPRPPNDWERLWRYSPEPGKVFKITEVFERGYKLITIQEKA